VIRMPEPPRGATGSDRNDFTFPQSPRKHHRRNLLMPTKGHLFAAAGASTEPGWVAIAAATG
jgi:hypothetical protein